jgi:hypothetical protein
MCHRRQDAWSVDVAGEHLRQLRIDLLDDARPQEEVACPLVGALEHLGQKVPGDVQPVTIEPPDDLVAVGAVLDGHGRHAQPGGPTAGAPEQIQHRFLGQDDLRLTEQLPDLVQGEGQIVGVDLGDQPGQAVTVQRQARLGPADNHDPKLWGRVAEHEVDLVQYARVGQMVGPVEHKHARILQFRQAGRKPDQQ